MNKRSNNGFTLVEILIAMVIMGLVVAAVYNTFISTKVQTNVQEEVFEVQQNLRASLDFMVNDIRMAGFLSPVGVGPIVDAPEQLLDDANGDGDFEDTDERFDFTFVNITSSGRYARIKENPTSTGIIVASGMGSQFTDGDNVLVLKAKTRAKVTDAFELTSSVNDSFVIPSGDATGTVAGDLIVGLPDGAVADDTPLRITYRLLDDGASDDPAMNELRRSVAKQDGTEIENELIGEKISNISFVYRKMNGDTTTTLDEIASVEITITGQTDDTRATKVQGSSTKLRNLSTTVKIRNGVVYE